VANTILVVEDNALNLKYFNDLLQAEGYDTLQAGDSEAAFAAARSRRPDLILMDLRLPGLSGFDAASRFKADGDLAAIPIVAVSALSGKADEAQARDAGCISYLRKPVSASDLLEMVRSVLESRPVH
jgi:two-component system cell cycle response regulator DivK